MVKKCKECKRQLPDNYNYDTCESCRNQRNDKIKKRGALAGAALAIIGIAWKFGKKYVGVE